MDTHNRAEELGHGTFHVSYFDGQHTDGLQMLRSPLGALWRLFFRMRYHGTRNIPATGGLIIAANHQTYIDPFWLSIPIKRPLRYLAWDEAFDWPLVGKLLGLFGAWPLQIERSDPAAIRTEDGRGLWVLRNRYRSFEAAPIARSAGER